MAGASEGSTEAEGIWARRIGGENPKSRQAKNTDARSITKVQRMLAPAAVFVAVVAGGGTVGVAVDTTMLTIGAGLGVIVVGVTVDASKAGIVCGYLVAVVAHRFVVRNRKVGVVKGGAEPTGGGVARVARCWIAGSNVVGHTATESLCTGPSGLMAAIAGGVGSSEAVIIVNVASGARGFGGVQVRAGEGPARSCVVERAGIPRRGVVASGAE